MKTFLCLLHTLLLRSSNTHPRLCHMDNDFIYFLIISSLTLKKRSINLQIKFSANAQCYKAYTVHVNFKNKFGSIRLHFLQQTLKHVLTGKRLNMF